MSSANEKKSRQYFKIAIIAKCSGQAIDVTQRQSIIAWKWRTV